MADTDTIRSGDRVTGAPLRHPVRGVGDAWRAATAHPLASLIAIDMLRAGGSAVDAAIAANIALGFLEPIACGIGGDAFALLWDPNAREVVGLNGSGRSPAALTLETHRARAGNGLIALARRHLGLDAGRGGRLVGCCTSATAS